VSISFQIPPELESTFRFIQGQNITIRSGSGTTEIRRSYSICSSPSETELRIAVKEVPNGAFSTFANRLLKVGDVLEVMPPTGKFYTELDPERTGNYLGIAAGSGITPLLSILKTTLNTEPKSRFTLLYGNRTRSSIIFREQLEALKNRYMQRLNLVYVFSREEVDSPANAGRLNADKCRQFDKRIVDFREMDHIFLCGPLPMIESITGWLTEIGVPQNQIHYELFNAPATLNTTNSPNTESGQSDQQTEVTITLDGVNSSFVMNWHGQPILDAALATGRDLPFACKGGVCATCKARLMEGTVTMDSNYALEPDELDAGFILTCQSHPRSHKIHVDFDAK